jgi:IS1 family transposase
VRKQLWACLTVVQPVKQEAQQWVMRHWILSGSCSSVRYLLNVIQGLGTTINTAYIERLNATFRAHLASFARRTRCPTRQLQTVSERVFLVGCCTTCWVHTSLPKKTPAWSAGLTDHRWSLHEFLWAHLLPHWASTT